MGILEKGREMRSCTRQPPEPIYARALVLGDAHMVPPSPLAAILENGYQPRSTVCNGESGDRMQVAKEMCISFSCSKAGLLRSCAVNGPD